MPVAGAKGYGASQGERIVIERGGRRMAVRLPRYGVFAVVASLLAIVVWSLSSAAYMIFHDTVVAELRAGANASANVYEAHLATLRDELERARTRSLVAASGMDDRFAELAARQAAIEKRQSRLDELADLGAGLSARAERPSPAAAAKPQPLDVESHGAPELRSSSGDAADRMSASLDAIEVDQARALEGLAIRTSERRKTLEQVYDAARIRRPAVGDGRARGGPFEPLPAGALTFESRALEVEADRVAVTAFERGLAGRPSACPSPPRRSRAVSARGPIRSSAASPSTPAWTLNGNRASRPAPPRPGA
ncbi:hypothetical protein [Chenggangzhangella methanolivorans]|uniref:hypothetical protein n=1 Tax=Chenggangzhangella methanolivorans TaxID=1437009 RepID=UPI0021BD2AA4|nr:hypothetical protein [Chenggangzhangella methanolivorans]